MRATLASEVLGRVKTGSPEFFEKLVVELLLKMGYGGSRADAGQAVGKARGPRSRSLSAPSMGSGQKGRVHHDRILLVGRGGYVEHIDPKVVLLDGRRLAELIIDSEVGVTTAPKSTA